MGAGSLGRIIEDMFRVKGYGIVRSSPENTLIIVKKGEEVLSIFYSDLETPSTAGEADMFISISESEGATGMLFISPARIQRDILGQLRGKGVQVWDRNSLVLAIGEHELRKASFEEVEEWEPIDATVSERSLITEQVDIDPLSELKRYERGLKGDGAGFKVTKVVTLTKEEEARRSLQRSEGVMTRPFPEKKSVPGPGSMPIGSNASEAATEVKAEPPPTLDEALGSVMPSLSRTYRIAPLRINMDEALSMAPGSLKGLELVYRPCILMQMAYRIRSLDGEEEADRSVAFMIDLMDRSVTDIPSSAASEMTWADGMEPGSRSEGTGTIPPEEGRRAGAESLRFRDHTMERKVHDGMMSTIYQEMESHVVEGSIRTVSEVEVQMPIWKGRLSFGGMVWLMDGFSGTQRRTR